jgi:alpha-tubulin suppressor-like RCC1 family protein
MAITDKEKGVWGLDQVYNKINQGSIWEYTGTNALFTWGSNNSGALGLNQAQAQLGGASSPIQIPGSWRSLGVQNSLGANQGAVNTDGELFVWGDNNQGQLGQNDEIHRSSPTQLPGTWSDSFKIGINHSVMVKADGTLWTQGHGGDGQLGQNNKIYRSSPVQVPGTWSTTQGTMTANYYSTGAIKEDGTLWGWGANHNGQLGVNNRTYYSSPIQIPGTNWSRLYGDFMQRFGIKTDGTLWAWGHNQYGVLGLNDQGPGNRRSSPVQIPGTTWSVLSSTYGNAAAAIKTDGTLYVWGSGSYGKLGLNATTNRSSPTQIPGTTWSKISISADNMTAIKTDGTMWGWGKSTGGQLGQNTMETVSSPIQIPGTTWEDVTSSYLAKAAIQLQ